MKSKNYNACLAAIIRTCALLDTVIEKEMADNIALVSDSDSTCTNDTVSEKMLDISSRDALAEGVLSILKPSVEEIDERVKEVRQSQIELRLQIDLLAEELRKISEEQNFIPLELDTYVKKLAGTKRKAVLVNNILQNVQARLTKLHRSIIKESEKKKKLLETSAPGASAVSEAHAELIQVTDDSVEIIASFEEPPAEN